MKWSEGAEDALFTESYCKICNAQLISKSQRTAHYESKKHANKVRLFYMLHPEDGGPPPKRLRTDNPDAADVEVDRNKCCTVCNMFFTSTVVAQSHYQGKTHAKKLRLVLGPKHTGNSLTDASTPTSVLIDAPKLTPPFPTEWSNTGVDVGVYEVGPKCCLLCGAWFNHPLMAQQHYEGRKHRRNASRIHLLQQIAVNTLGLSPATGLRGNYSCSVCNVELNSIEQYHAHLQGSRHQNNLKQSKT